jgi:hypothetical protein
VVGDAQTSLNVGDSQDKATERKLWSDSTHRDEATERLKKNTTVLVKPWFNTI